MRLSRHARTTLMTLIVALLAACAQAAPAPTAAPTPTTAPASAAPPTAEPTTTSVLLQRTDAELAAKLDDFLTKMSAGQLFSGIVTVRRNQTIVFQKGYGFADRAQKIPFTPQTINRIGELSMQFTAAATLLLEQQGKLTVQDPICSYIAPCPEAWKPITLHHLLSHTSGIPDYLGTSAGDALGKSGATANQVLDMIRDTPLEYTPGADRVYSHSGFVLLGLVIEQVSGQSYGDFMRTAIFEPLGMRHSGYGDPPAAMAIGYLGSGDQTAVFDVSALGASGGLYTTSEDMLIWMDGLFGAKLLDATQLDKMLTSHVRFGEKDDLGSGYGIVLSTRAGQPNAGQCGGPFGYGSCAVRYLDSDISIVMLGNQDTVDIFTVIETLEQIALGVV